MKKVFFIHLMLLHIVCITSAQTYNTPNTTTTPLTPTATPVTLPGAFTTPTGGGLNLTRTFIPTIPLTSPSDAQFLYNPGGSAGSYFYDAKVSTTYTNGWGSPIETIDRGDGIVTDVITPIDDQPSLITNSFLPYSLPTPSYFQSTAFTDQRTYYNGTYPNEGKFTYSQKIISYPSKVPTVVTAAPGSSFVGNINTNGTTVTTTINTGLEGIIIYNVVAGAAVSSGSFYGASTLTVKTTTTPGNGKMVEYFDIDNREVCKQVYASTSAIGLLTTYYVYDDLNKLYCTITPGFKTYSSAYNNYGSPVVTTIPGQTGSGYIVYDLKNRPVLIQTPLLNALGMYKFNIYDSRDRVIISGLLTDATLYSTWQSTLYATSPTITPGTLLDYLINGVTGSYPTSIPNCEIEKVNFYDTYPISRTFNNSYSSYYLLYANAVSPVPYMVTQGLPTASMARVRNGGMGASSDSWVCSVYFYDQKGRMIQTQTLNPANAQPYATCLGGATSAHWDVHTMQYSFIGNKLVDILFYNDNSSSNKQSTTIVNYYALDVTYGERLVSETESIDNGPDVNIATYTYDNLGRATKKSLGGVEIQNYDYSIRGQLTGINRDYVNNPCGTAGTTASFGCIIDYDYGFSMPRYDGKISGILWAGASHTTPVRAYGYQYDPAGRLTSGDFRQFCLPTSNAVSCALFSTGETWNNNEADFTASNISYDKDGNLVTMNQRGTIAVPGSTATTGVNMDILSYLYNPNGTLSSVTDAVTANYHLGDFVGIYTPCSSTATTSTSALVGAPPGGTTTSGGTATATTSGGTTLGSGGTYPCATYTYDADGNLASDVNKSITSMVYNEMDKPISVTFLNGSTINNIYTADGTLIQKTISDNSTATPTVTANRYWGPFLYTNNNLQYALHDEGRSTFHPATPGLPVTPTSVYFTYDYFVKDHLGNVRTVVTGNVTNLSTGSGSTFLSSSYIATHEVAASATEDAIFTNIDNVRYAKPASTSPTDTKAAYLNGADSTRRIGTAIMLKVMTGDKFDLSVQGYWTGSPTSTTESSSTMMNAIISTLTGAQGNVQQGENTGAQLVNEAFSPDNYAAYQSILNSVTNPRAPRAYLNYLVFDEKMNLLPDQSGAIQISAISESWQPIHTPMPITMLQSGYIAVYISDASSTDVYFDYLTIGAYSGSLIQEQHYYPFGLPINEGESATVVDNKFKYQGKELTADLNYNLSDFGARQYDQQIGRFWGIDPLNQYPSGYTGMGNDPANKIDPSGCQVYSPNYFPGSNVQTAQPSSNFGWTALNPDINLHDYGIQDAINELNVWAAASTQDATTSGSGSGGASGDAIHYDSKSTIDYRVATGNIWDGFLEYNDGNILMYNSESGGWGATHSDNSSSGDNSGGNWLSNWWNSISFSVGGYVDIGAQFGGKFFTPVGGGGAYANALSRTIIGKTISYDGNNLHLQPTTYWENNGAYTLNSGLTVGPLSVSQSFQTYGSDYIYGTRDVQYSVGPVGIDVPENGSTSLHYSFDAAIIVGIHFSLDLNLK